MSGIASIINEALNEVTFPYYSFETRTVDEGYQLRGAYMDVDVDTGKNEVQHTAWYPISRHSVKSEIVRTMLKCVLTSREHYAREHFLYKGKAVFGPHFDVDVLWEIADLKDRRVDTRPKHG